MSPEVLHHIELAGAALSVLGALLVTSQQAAMRVMAFSIWIVANTFLVVLFLDKGMNTLALMQFIYFILAIVGFSTNLTAWKREHRAREETQATP
jgi:nicotinamide riboside transporter PnuC